MTNQPLAASDILAFPGLGIGRCATSRTLCRSLLYRIRDSRSASASQASAAWIISSLGGIPFGNTALSNASRSALARVRRPRSFEAAGLVDAVRRRRPPLAPDAEGAVERARELAGARPRLERVVAPTTPCACRRWAPSAAARLNVRPHSGHVKSCWASRCCFRGRPIVRSLQGDGETAWQAYVPGVLV